MGGGGVDLWKVAEYMQKTVAISIFQPPVQTGVGKPRRQKYCNKIFLKPFLTNVKNFVQKCFVRCDIICYNMIII